MKSIKARPFAAVVLLSALLGGGHALADDAAKPTPVLHVLRPVASAVVRETVPIKVAIADLPSDGYVGITIDTVFQTARILPPASRKTGVIFDWDTKASYTTSDDPDTQKYYADGAHTLKVDLYDRSGSVLGETTIPVEVRNKVPVPAQGIKLTYHWSSSQQLRYLRQSQLDNIPITNGGPAPTPQNVEATLIHFSRSVEDTSGSTSLVRDTVQPKSSFLVSRGQTQLLAAAYQIKSQYRTVNPQGYVLRVQAPLSPGQHVGFSIPVLPARRVAVGDSWQSPVQISLDWAGTETASVTAESRLEGFEWQNGYPSAKIRETYSGPVTFHVKTVSNGYANPAPTTGASTSFDAQTVKYERVIYFAYGAGRLVRSQTTIDITADQGSGLLNAIGVGGASGGGYGGPPPGYGGPMGGAMGNLLGGDPEENKGGEGPPPGYGGPPPGYGGPPPGYGGPSIPGGPPPGYGGPSIPGGPPPGYGGGFPGAPGGAGYGGQGAGVAPSTSTKLKLTDIISLDVGGAEPTSLAGLL